jgi:pimeloyl-ACP methyl ester carboxylesterase
MTPQLATPLYHEVHGNGRPVVLLHGFAASSYEWRPLVPDLATTHQVVLVDLKGFGRSDKPRDGRYGVRDQSELLVQFLVGKGLRDVTLVGHSLGGFVALLTAITRPDLLSSLVLIDTLCYRQELPFIARLLITPIVGPLVHHLVPARLQVRLGLNRAFYRNERVRPDQVETYAAFLRAPGARYALRETVRDIIPPDLDAIVGQYRNIARPTLIVWARHDDLVPLAHGERLSSDIAGSRLVILEDTGHDCPEETPEAVLATIRSFLQ